MSANSDHGFPPEFAQYHENRRNFPQEELARYAGKQVAFSLDGKRILASGDDYLELDAKLRAAGIPPNQTVFAYIDRPDEAYLG